MKQKEIIEYLKNGAVILQYFDDNNCKWVIRLINNYGSIRPEFVGSLKFFQIKALLTGRFKDNIEEEHKKVNGSHITEYYFSKKAENS